MDVLLGAILLVLVLLLAFWLWPSWDALTAQFLMLFSRMPAGQIEPPEAGPMPPVAAIEPPLPGPSAPQLHGKRHTVLPHQARGR